ncbi:MAG: molybdopterin-dependent oxidoreductase, partial [Dehalococcoidia bacterium]
LANHSDRCLTCHRLEHCRTGDICLRDNVVTHRCVTCSKNYRCELQTASDMADIGRATVEPYLDEARTYYQSQQPEPDRANPYVEFDPQRCIICTRCVRASDDLRHTTAITLAGRGFSTRIAFGSGGTIDESNCDFCGACIDVCPTAALMETPNKWVARPEQWVSTACTECALGCTIQMGVKNGRGVIVRPGSGNDVSRDQICVRGRFGYDQIRDKHRLKTGRLGRGDDARDAEPSAVLDDAAGRLNAIINQHGPQAVGLLGSGQATNEDNYLLRKLAQLLGTPNLDSSVGYVWGAVVEALQTAFGSEHLPNQLTAVESADVIVVIADDLSASNNVLGVRVKDAAVQRRARVVTVSGRRNPVDDVAAVELRPQNGDSAATVQALVRELLKDVGRRERLAQVEGLGTLGGGSDVPGVVAAAQALGERANGTVAVLLAPARHNAAVAGAQTRAAANLAIALAGPAAAPASLHLLPPENNAVGLRDMGVRPGEHGLGVLEMLAAARDGRLKALIVAKDNPLLTLPDRDAVRRALAALDLLLVIDDVPTDTVLAATHALPDLSPFAKDGTITNADRQILRLRRAYRPQGSARPAWEHLHDLAVRLAAARGIEPPPAYASAAAVMDEISATDPRYAQARYSRLLRSTRQPPDGAATQALQSVPPLPREGDGLVLLP